MRQDMLLLQKKVRNMVQSSDGQVEQAPEGRREGREGQEPLHVALSRHYPDSCPMTAAISVDGKRA
jgi:hypothetical protein